MKKNILIVFFIGICALAGIYHMAEAQAVIDQKSVLSGTVSWTAQPGIAVNEGAALVKITTMTGETAASRASANGTVSEILVNPGEEISVGQVVARITAE
ncbi:biotin/lipoyl-containing protein [Pectinatus cerevisiiphilus]|uniref:Biotin-dependent enzyme n=1 Tax=Pectinatus cerevisiiphilus TaxID=86956 RepID=A0A4R3KBV1_9FIRM|nr:biotin/lipoyl-containing protein [Pectinatus cerevisiiphilus]TCS80505.1 biotin-dependent enzyme [Pectinatus cerevisiiphilus]